MLLAEIVIVLSSAKLHKDPLLYIRRMSFAKTSKKRGPKIDPCGTPWFREPYLLK